MNLCPGMVGMAQNISANLRLVLLLKCVITFGCQAQTQAIYLKRFSGGNLFWEGGVSIVTCVNVLVLLKIFPKGFQVVLVIITKTKRKWNILKSYFERLSRDVFHKQLQGNWLFELLTLLTRQ